MVDSADDGGYAPCLLRNLDDFKSRTSEETLVTREYP